MDKDNNAYAPVVVFTYNRLSHVKRLVESLQLNHGSDKTEIFFFSDGPKTYGDKEKDSQAQSDVNRVRDYLYTVSGFKSVKIIIRDENIGLARNVIDGVSKIVNHYGNIIVLEDDLVTESDFLNYMNAALVKYRDLKPVYSITGYSFINNKYDTERVPEFYFLPIICSWSWATWKDRWSSFDPEAKGHEVLLSNKRERFLFNFCNSINYCGILQSQIKGEVDSWAIRWYYSVYKNKGYTLFPRFSYVTNEGFDGSGTHTRCKPLGSGSVVRERDSYVFSDDVIIDQNAISAVQKSVREWEGAGFGYLKRRGIQLANFLRKVLRICAEY